jgi:hypothetical protein
MLNLSIFLLIFSHALLASFAVIIGVFYLFPHNFYFATPAYVITFFAFLLTNYLAPVGTKLLAFKDAYLQTLVCRPGLSWGITAIIIVLVLGWTLVMFDSIRSRYTYMKSIDGALSSIGVDGMALPTPELLAKAFNAAPDRPEVPFILTRASRLIASDLLTPMFQRYNKAFLDGVDRAHVLERFGKSQPPNRIAIGNEDTNLPRRDPIRFLTSVAFETSDKTDQQWALSTLSDLRKDDAGALLQVAIWEHNLAAPTGSQDEQRAALQASIENFDRILQTGSNTNFSSISFVSDHIFQQGLDYVASLKIEMQSLGRNDSEKCGFSSDIIGNYERIMLLRRRLSNATDLLWWEPPGKLFLYYLYLFFGHQTVNIGLDTIEQIKVCPSLMGRLQQMYDAPAFRSFQNPDAWTQGTPVSLAYNGSAGVRQLRDWLKRGW